MRFGTLQHSSVLNLLVLVNLNINYEDNNFIKESILLFHMTQERTPWEGKLVKNGSIFLES